MSWQQRYFKNDKVWVKVDDQGELVVEDGRVPMRYQNDEDAKVYRASPRNIHEQVYDEVDDRPGGSPMDESVIEPPQVPDAEGRLKVSTTVPDELLDVFEPPEGVVEIHTDGACSGNPGPCGYGAVIRDGFYYHELSQYLGEGTNNIAELMAIKVALESVTDKTRPVRLYTDSRYCLGVLTMGWKAKANRELILSIRELLDEFEDLDLRKIEGHAGEPLNERADDLATDSVKRHN